MAALLRNEFPLNMGRIIPAVNVRILETPQENADADEAAKLTSGEECSPDHETEITLLKEGERVKTIVIKCACGKVISLDCTY